MKIDRCAKRTPCNMSIFCNECQVGGKIGVASTKRILCHEILFFGFDAIELRGVPALTGMVMVTASFFLSLSFFFGHLDLLSH
jgi:hypothetical protein